MGFTEFQWVLLGFNRLQRVSMGSTGGWWVRIVETIWSRSQWSRPALPGDSIRNASTWRGWAAGDRSTRLVLMDRRPTSFWKGSQPPPTPPHPTLHPPTSIAPPSGLQSTAAIDVNCMKWPPTWTSRVHRFQLETWLSSESPVLPTTKKHEVTVDEKQHSRLSLNLLHKLGRKRLARENDVKLDKTRLN